MNEIITFIQKEAEIVINKRLSKKYIKLKILPIIKYINLSSKSKFLIGGSQGVGKTSLIIILKRVFKKYYNKRILSLSLDDYYLSKKDRAVLSKKYHKLLNTRGVPGTHNYIKLISDVRKFDKHLYPITINKFDKLIDDISSKKSVTRKKCDILILEGWCCGCTKIDMNYLYKNINDLEKKFDKDFNWRIYYNNKIDNEYKRLFNLFDKFIYIKAPSFKYVLNWRLKQENRNYSNSINSKKMKFNEIKNFIQYYEKITRWMLKTAKTEADLIITVNEDQNIKSLKVN